MTSHLILFCYFIVLLWGMLSLASASVITIVTKDILLRYCIFFYSIYTLQILKAVIRYYLVLNLPQLLTHAAPAVLFFEFVLHSFMMYSVVVLVHFLVSLPRARLCNTVILAFSFLTFGFQFYLNGLGNGAGSLVISESYDIEYGDIVFLLFILYVILIGLLRMKYIKDEQKKIILKKLLLVGIVFFPGLVYDSMIYSHRMMIIAPVIYFFFSVLLIYYLIRFYLKNYYLSSDEAEEDREDFFERYGISEREKDTLLLLLKGYSNRKIGDTLYISLSTVKSHVYSVFKKTGVTSRYELIHFIKENSPEPSKVS